MTDPNVRMNAETGSYKLTGQDAKLMHYVIVKVVEKDWPLLSLYLVVIVVGLVASYVTSRWDSVGFSFVVDAFTFVVGLLMVQTVITITNEIR
jgi:hypothetical protein